MNIIDIDIRDDLVHYHFVLERRINFLKGDSATGKTTFADLVQRRNNGEVLYKLDGCSDIVCVIADSFKSTVEDNRHIVIVIDDLFLVKSDKFTSAIKKYMIQHDLCFIIITRMEMDVSEEDKGLLYDNSSVYELESNDGDYVLSRIV